MKHIILSILILISFNGCNQNAETIHVDENLDIPLGPCMEVNKEILGNSIDTKEFCKCYILKMYEQVKSNPEQLKYFKEGKINELPRYNKEQLVIIFQDCLEQNRTSDTSAKITITPRMAEGMKNIMKKDLSGADFEQTNDVDSYCDCIINGIQSEFTANEIYNTDFRQSTKFIELELDCLNKTKK